MRQNRKSAWATARAFLVDGRLSIGLGMGFGGAVLRYIGVAQSWPGIIQIGLVAVVVAVAVVVSAVIWP